MIVGVDENDRSKDGGFVVSSRLEVNAICFANISKKQISRFEDLILSLRLHLPRGAT